MSETIRMAMVIAHKMKRRRFGRVAIVMRLFVRTAKDVRRERRELVPASEVIARSGEDHRHAWKEVVRVRISW